MDYRRILFVDLFSYNYMHINFDFLCKMIHVVVHFLAIYLLLYEIKRRQICDKSGIIDRILTPLL